MRINTIYFMLDVEEFNIMDMSPYHLYIRLKVSAFLGSPALEAP